MPKKGKTKMSRKTIPENFELSDDEPTMIKLNEEQKLTSKIFCLIVQFVSVSCS